MRPLLLAFVLVLGACRKDAAPPPPAAPPSARLPLVQLREAWKMPAAGLFNNSFLIASYVAADDVIVFLEDSRRQMFEISDGGVRGALSDVPGPSSGAPPLILWTSDGWHAYDARSGQLRWEWSPDDQGGSPYYPLPFTVTEEASLLLSTWNKLVRGGPSWLSVKSEPVSQLVAVDTARGVELWRRPVARFDLLGIEQDAGAGRAVIDDRGRVSLFDLTSSKPVWSWESKAGVEKLLLAKDVVLVLSDRVVTAIDARDGRVLAERSIDNWSRLDRLSATKELVFVTKLDRPEIEAWPVASGPTSRPLWVTDTRCPLQPLVDAADADALYVHCSLDRVDRKSKQWLLLLDAATGKELKRIELPSRASLEFVHRPGGDVALLIIEDAQVTVWARVP